jgi:hypothetical protein
MTGPVNSVALFAIKGLSMDVKFILIIIKGIFVTAPADLFLASLEQTRCIPCMGTMTRCATASLFIIQQVAVKVQDLFFYCLMTAQAGFCPNFALTVTLGTPFFIRLMEDITHHGLSVTSMRVVAGETITYLSGEIPVDLPHCIAFMTRKTKFVRL